MERVLFQQRHIRRERMPGNVEAQQLLLRREQLVLRPFGKSAAGVRLGRGAFFQHAEKRTLPALAVGHDAGGPGQSTVNRSVKGGARFAETIAGAALDEGFQDFAVDGPQIHPLA